MIKNFKGIDMVGKNHYDRNRLGNKITLVISDNAIPIGISLATANVNDQTQIFPVLHNIDVKIKKSKLIADGAYVSQSLKNN